MSLCVFVVKQEIKVHSNQLQSRTNSSTEDAQPKVKPAHKNLSLTLRWDGWTVLKSLLKRILHSYVSFDEH